MSDIAIHVTCKVILLIIFTYVHMNIMLIVNLYLMMFYVSTCTNHVCHQYTVYKDNIQIFLYTVYYLHNIYVLNGFWDGYACS